MLTIRPAAGSDRAFWFSLDAHLPEAMFARKVREGEALVDEEDGRPVAILRWSFFWDEIPFCNLLYVVRDRQRRGIGRTLLTAWEDQMRAAGYDRVLVSTQANEEGQHFYRKLGYRDCGALLLTPGDPTELFFVKELDSQNSEVRP
ncbi:MAG: GNAT family N-acetyltransferase [Clostridiales bacterium]|nr:GNAT family N-acetyltransferase [Clostridiales bacterium]